tara:strand:- start:25 stop:165 length:141 start_codon:yes stop_codon:yes gene_type:complete
MKNKSNVKISLIEIFAILTRLLILFPSKIQNKKIGVAEIKATKINL